MKINWIGSSGAFDWGLDEDVNDLIENLDRAMGGSGEWTVQVEDFHNFEGKGWSYRINHGSPEAGNLLNIERIVYQDRGEILHDRFVLSPELQGKGLADHVLKFSEKLSREFGIDKITLEANLDVGGYAWLRKGFAPLNPKALVNKTVYFREKSHPALAASLEDAVRGMSDADVRRFFRSEEFRQYKPLFLGSKWDGEADLTDPEVRAALFTDAGRQAARTAAEALDNRLKRATYHSVQMERMKAFEVQDFNRLVPILRAQIDKIMYDADSSLISELTRGEYLAKMRLLERAQEDIRQGAVKRLTKRMEMLAEYEAEFEVESLIAYAKEAGVTAKITPSGNHAAFDLAKVRPLSASGDVLLPWVNEMTKAEQKTIANVFRRAYSEGWTNDEVKTILSGTAAKSFSDGLLSRMGKRNATIVRTAIQHVASSARQATWEANADIMDSYQWVSTLDSRTSLQCAGLDGQIFEVGKGPLPPIHPNCRSTTIAVLKGKLRVLSEGRTRASQDGPVDAKITYYEWLRGQSDEFIIETLGPGRAAIFLRPDMTPEKFRKLSLGSAFEPLSLEEMRRADGGSAAQPPGVRDSPDEAAPPIDLGPIPSKRAGPPEENGLSRPFARVDVETTEDDGVLHMVINQPYRKRDGTVTEHMIEVAEARISKRHDGIWRGMLFHVDEKYRNKGYAFELMRQAVLEVGPIQTSSVFSPAGKRQMEGLVRRGWATELEGGDYLIHFVGSRRKGGS